MTNMEIEQALRRAVLEELAWDALVDEANIDVSVDGPTVTLFGTVTSLAQKLAAQQAALAVDGVHDVANDVEVRVPADAALTDAALTEILYRVLAWDALVPDEHLSLDVVDGWVTIRGEVPTVRQRQESERALAAVIGVRGVSNEIVIERGGIGAEDVRMTVEGALIRRALHRANRVRVVVADGRVTLTGSVDSDADRAAVVGAVAHLRGVEAVCDDLQVVAFHAPAAAPTH